MTLNTGYLEFMYFPKTIPWLYGEPLSRLAYINTPAGTLLDVRFSEGAWADSSDILMCLRRLNNSQWCEEHHTLQQMQTRYCSVSVILKIVQLIYGHLKWC